MVVKYSVRISFPISETNVADILSPEIRRDTDRAAVRMESDDQNFHIYIDAMDNAALKSALGGITRLLVLISRFMEE